MEVVKSNVLITGASRGLGRAMAVAFAEAGASRIFINCLSDTTNAEETCRLVRSHGAEADIVEADVADPIAVKTMHEQVRSALNGRTLDILINNAGVNLYPGSWNEQSDADIMRTLAVDLAGAMHCTRAFAPDMHEAGRGCIINIASNNGIAGTAAIAAYSAAKAGLIQYTRIMAVELAPNVRVNTVAPGVCDTDMTQAAGEQVIQSLTAATPLSRLGRPEEVADAVLFLARNDFTTGITLSVDGGITLPSSAD